MRKLSADMVFPISSEPIPNGVVVVEDDGTVLDVLHANDSLTDLEHYDGMLCPGFINAHCHLELSYLKGKVEEKTTLSGFIKNLNDVRWEATEDEILEAIAIAEEEMITNGIVGVGDICNGSSTFHRKANSSLNYHSFIELFGFDPDKSGNNFNKGLGILKEANQHKLQASITPHAPYSLSVELFERIKEHAAANNSLLSIHNQESASENEMFIGGTGKMIELFKEYFQHKMENWQPSGSSSIVYAMSYLPANNKLLLVHNTYTKKEDIEWVQNQNPQAYWCLCPNANLYIEHKLPDILLFEKTNDKICIGTDSLASNHCLSILEELKTIAYHYPKIDISILLKWATLNGANYFGWQKELGSFEQGKTPGVNVISNCSADFQLTDKSKITRLL